MSKFEKLIGKRVLVKYNEEWVEVGGIVGFSGYSGASGHAGPKGTKDAIKTKLISNDDDLLLKKKELKKKELREFQEFRPLELSKDKKFLRGSFVQRTYSLLAKEADDRYGVWYELENINDALEIITIL